MVSRLTDSADTLIGLTAHGRLAESDAAEACCLSRNRVLLPMRLPESNWRDLVQTIFATEHDPLPRRRYPMAALPMRGRLVWAGRIITHDDPTRQA